ncbi:right-handed parallel beta-helix repeat-containing protein [Candidatus Pacearchaeota archaeon]|nr:right-handed parallel beta-helix repeat-containing protein [Candidatus Pacearchaeota archaeon]
MNKSLTVFDDEISGSCFLVSASNVELNCKGFSIYNTTNANPQPAIIGDEITNLTVRNCNITLGSSTTALQISSDNNTLITNNTFSSNSNGVVITSSNNVTISNNVFFNHTFNGISVIDGSNITILGNIIIGSLFNGVSVDTCNNIIISHNTVKNTTFGDAIVVGGNDYGINTTIYDNTVVSQRMGILVSSANNAYLANNFINNSFLRGVFLTGNNMTVFNNFIYNGTEAGIYVEKSVNTTISNNSIINISGSGLHLRWSNYTYIFDNNISFSPLSINVTDSLVADYRFLGEVIARFINSKYGSVRFLQTINGSGTNLSNDVKIESNKITIISDLRFNRTANISLYNLATNFDNPLIFKNDIACGTAQGCFNSTSLNVGNVSFNITGYGSYRVSVVSLLTLPGSSGGGSGGGSLIIRPVLLKLLLPDPVSSAKNGRLVLPIRLENKGSVALNGIVVKAAVAKNGALRKDLVTSFDTSSIDILPIGKSQNITLTVDVNTEEEGVYEILLNASVRDPFYQDFAKIFLTVGQGTQTQAKVLLAAQLIANNHECLEIKETLDEAQQLLSDGKEQQGQAKLDEAIQGCKNSISQKVSSQRRNSFTPSTFFIWVGVAILGAFVVGIGFYSYQRWRFQKAIES